MNSNDKATIHDVAKYCGLSTATVSRVLSGSDYPVKQKTRERILKAAEDLNYVPNVFGQALKTQQSHDIGIIIPTLSNSYYPTLLQGIYDNLISSGYNPILYNSYRQPEIEEKNIQLLMQKQVRGIIVVSINPDTAALQRALSAGCPIVVVEQEVDVDCVKVNFNFEAGAYKAVQHLIEIGHRKIGFIGAPLDRSSRKKMFDGYKRCLVDYGIDIRNDYIHLDAKEVDGGEIYEFKNGISAATQFSTLENRPTGYICINDMTALGAMKGFAMAGLHVPEDVSVFGFDNIPYAEIATPELATIDQCTYEMGTLSSKILIETIEDPGKAHYSITLEPSVVLRNSVRKID